MVAAGRSRAWSEPPLTIRGRDRPHIRSHLKGNLVAAPQCLTLPRALVPPRGEKRPSMLPYIGPLPPSYQELRYQRTAAPDAQPPRCVHLAAQAVHLSPDPYNLLPRKSSTHHKTMALESNLRQKNGHPTALKGQNEEDDVRVNVWVSAQS